MSTAEVALTGTPRQYLAFARALRIGSGTVEFPGTDADIHQATVRCNQAETVVLSYDDHRLLVNGPAHFLRILAGTLTGATNSLDPGRHVHIDYFPGHYYLGEGSVPLVLHDAHPPDDRPEPEEILSTLGFEVLGRADDVNGVTVEDTFVMTVHLDLAPDIRVTGDSPDAAETAWRKNADQVGLLEDARFFISIPGAKMLNHPWTEVRLSPGLFLRRMFELTGTIDFHAIAPSGMQVVNLSEEEDSTWIINVDPYA